MPAISVIVPTRCRPHLVGRAVDSILAQTFTDFEVLLVDNSPAPLQIARRHDRLPCLADRRVLLLEDDRPHNAAGARNLGLAHARGEWVTYLDDDDVYRPTKLERQICAANASRLPLGLCGTVYHVPFRKRLITRDAWEIGGDDLLLYFPGMPTMFHRWTPEVELDASLNAGEDLHYFHRLLQHYRVHQVFNVPDALVDVYQQDANHVNLNATAVWKACEATLRDFGADYSDAACKVFHDRARLQFYKLEGRHFREMLLLCAKLFFRGGAREGRLILNCILYRIPWMRRWLVH